MTMSKEGKTYGEKLIIDIIKNAKPLPPETDPSTKAKAQKNLGKFPPSADSLEMVLSALKIGLRYNVRSLKKEWRMGPEESWDDSNDRAIGYVRRNIENEYSLLFSDARWKGNVDALLYDRTCDPFKEWLESLPEWDGKKRLDTYFTDFFKTDHPLAPWAGRFIFLGAIWRTFVPGCTLDELPLIRGAQGVGKSKFVRACLPNSPSDWFSDGLRLHDTDKAKGEVLQSRVIVEVSEMAGIARAELQALKAFLTSTDDGASRKAYRWDPESSLRRCVFIGTTDSAQPLPSDDQGNRRFVLVDVSAPGRAVEPYMEELRDLLWAEALHIFHEGQRANLPRELFSIQRRINAENRVGDEIIEDLLSHWVGDYPPVERGSSFRLVDIADKIDFSAGRSNASLSRLDETRLSRALRRSGFETLRTTDENGVQRRVWVFQGIAEGDEK